MGSEHTANGNGHGRTPGRLSTDAALAAVLALLVAARAARAADTREQSVEALLAEAGLSGREIGLVTGRATDAEGPALWRTLQRRRAAVASAEDVIARPVGEGRSYPPASTSSKRNCRGDGRRRLGTAPGVPMNR